MTDPPASLSKHGFHSDEHGNGERDRQCAVTKNFGRLSHDQIGSLGDREAALRAIKSSISAMGYRASLPTTKSGDDVKLMVNGNETQVRVEVNYVFRGTVLPVSKKSLIGRAQDLFTTDVVVPVPDTAELYGSKLVAAMDRQHPRDIFDVMKMVERFGWQASFIDCFVAYLAGHNRPVHEVLFPRKLSLEPAFTREFAGMTREPIALDVLEQTQEQLIVELPRALTAEPLSTANFCSRSCKPSPHGSCCHSRICGSYRQCNGDLLNLRRLKTRDASRFAAQYEELAARFQSLAIEMTQPATGGPN